MAIQSGISGRTLVSLEDEDWDHPGLLFRRQGKEMYTRTKTNLEEVLVEAEQNPRSFLISLFAALMYFTSTAGTFICGKMLYNSGSDDAPPGMVVMVSTCQGVATFLWASIAFFGRACSRTLDLIESSSTAADTVKQTASWHSVQSKAVMESICSPRFWLFCVPYSVGYFFVYYLAYAALEYVSSVAFVALMMARVNVDMFLAAFLLNQSSRASRVSSANMIVACAAVHMLTVPKSDVSASLPLGSALCIAFNVVSSMTYTYVPWLRKHGYREMIAIAFVTSLQQAFGGLTVACIINGGFDGLLDGFDKYKAWSLVAASLLLDSTCLFGLKYLSPLTITLLGGALQVPVMLIFEVLVFDAPLEAPYIGSAVCVLASVASFMVADSEENQPSDLQGDAHSECTDEGKPVVMETQEHFQVAIRRGPDDKVSPNDTEVAI